MDDRKIIALYWDRDEEAIRATDAAYGKPLHRLAERIVQNREDAQECVSDTYFAAWDSIPPHRPSYFFAYLAKICRNFAFGILDKREAAKRQALVVELTYEMQECVPDRMAQDRFEDRETGQAINAFLETLRREERLIFLRRYWYADTIAEIAERYEITQSKVKTQLHRTRQKFRDYLEKEGIAV